MREASSAAISHKQRGERGREGKRCAVAPGKPWGRSAMVRFAMC